MQRFVDDAALGSYVAEQLAAILRENALRLFPVLESCGVPYMTPFAGGRGTAQALIRMPAANKSRREPALRPGRR